MKRLILILLSAALLLSLMGCGKGKDSSAEGSDDSDTTEAIQRPEPVLMDKEAAEPILNTVTAFLDAYREKDPDAGQYLMGGGEGELTFEGAAGIIASGLSYRLGDVYSYGSAYYVETEITTPDFGGTFDALQKELGEKASQLSPEEVDALFEQRLLKSEATAAFRVPCFLYPLTPEGAEQTQAEYRISITGDFSNAICGGAPAYFMQILSQAMEEMSAKK